MKILLVHSGDSQHEAIDLWRIKRPFAELEKHVDWQIDHQPYLIDDSILNADYQADPEALVKELQKLGEYDIVWSSYFPDATLFDAVTFAQEKFGTKFVLDVDDDFYNVMPTNPLMKEPDAERIISETQWGIEQASYLVTSCTSLKDWYGSKRTNPTYALPNYIGGYEHKPFDNGSSVVIAFFGSVTHKIDLEKTGCLAAIKRIMKQYPNVVLGSVGLPLNITGTLKKRYTFWPGIPGAEYVTELWPRINADICVAPLVDHIFNRRKTNIKWQETALIPAAFVGSWIPPYKGTVEHEKTGLLVHDGEDAWYAALEQLVLDKALRQTLAQNARDEVTRNWSIETKWPELKELVEDIYHHEP